MKKYKLLKDQQIEHNGRTLYRIEAIMDFSDVKCGDLGGYVENEYILSHRGDCWLYDNAKAYNLSLIECSAKIYDASEISSSIVTGNIEVKGTSVIKNNSFLIGDVTVEDEVMDNVYVTM